MALKGWIGAASGLPSLLVDGPAKVTADDRLLAVVGQGQHLVADGLAAPGVETVYRAGGDTVSLTRPTGDWYGVLVAGADGRSAPGLAYEHNGDPLDWDSTASRVAGVTRWAIRDEPVTGTGVVTCTPATEPYLWWVLQSHAPIMLIPTMPVPGVPPRTVIVNGVTRKRVTGELIEVTIKWIEHEPRAENTPQGAVPVTTWGEWADYGEAHPDTPGWQAWSALEVAKRVQGMP